MRDKRRIDIVLQQIRVQLLLPEHIDILALLYLVGDIVKNGFLRLFGFLRIPVGLNIIRRLFCLACVACIFGCVIVSCRLAVCSRLVLLLILLNTVFQRQILVVNIFEQYIIHHLVGEFAVFDAAEFDKGTDIIPIFLIRFTVRLAHAAQLVRHLLADVIGNLFHKAVVLQRASGNVQRQVWTVDHTFEQHQKLRNHFLDIIGNKHLIVVQLDRSLNGIVLCINLRKIQNTFQIKGIIHIQMNPEQRLFVIVKYLTIKSPVLLLRAVVGMFQPQRTGIAYRNGAFVDLDFIFSRRYLYDLFLAVLILLLLGLGFLMNVLHHHVFIGQFGLVDGLIFLRRAFFFQVNRHRHEGTVFLQHFPHPVLIGKFYAVLIEE